MPVKNRFAELQDDITAWRRDIHAHPEVLFETHRTSALVAEKLRQFGCDDVVTGIARTGVVGVIKGKSNRSGRTIGLRADMDALPMQETPGLDYASTVDGAMHGCGHDGHTAMLLGAAQYLAETRNFDGTTVVIFQPAEEGGGGGRIMVEEGLMDRFCIDEIYAMHNMPGIPVGQFAIREGAILASGDIFEITIKGDGGHGAKPHLAVDTVLAAADMVAALNAITSRNIDPLKHAVISVCGMQSESYTNNVMPQSVKLYGSARTLDVAVRERIVERIHTVTQATAALHGATAEIDLQFFCPPTVNDADATHHAIEAARAVVGEGVETNVAPSMAGEDFSFMLQARPGAFMLIGNGDSAALHNPAYNFDDAALPLGCSWFAEIAERRMPAA